MNISRITDDVALLLGVCPSHFPDSSGCPTLADRIRADVVELAAGAILSTPRDRLSGWRLLSDEGLTISGDGSAILPLPEDFLMLHSIRMSGWEREVTEALPSDHWLAKLQGSAWHGLRGTPSRPLAFSAVSPDGGKALRLYSVSPGATVASGWYMPAPQIDETGEIEIPPAAYPVLVESLTDRIRSSLST